MDYEMDLDYLDELLFDEPAEETDDDLLPAYLREAPTPSRTYGTLSYNRRSRCWMPAPGRISPPTRIPCAASGRKNRRTCCRKRWS